MTIDQAISSAAIRLRNHHYIKVILLLVTGFSYLVLLAAVTSIYSAATAKLLSVIGAATLLGLAVRNVKRPTDFRTQASLLLDEHLQSKERVISFVELAEEGKLQATSEYIKKQLAAKLEKLDLSRAVRLKFKKFEKIFILSAAFALLMTLAVLYFYNPFSTKNSAEVKILDNLLETTSLPPELEETLEELRDQLAHNDLTSSEVKDALSRAEFEISKARSDLEKGVEALAQNGAETGQPPQGEKTNPAPTAAPTPSPTAGPEQKSAEEREKEDQGKEEQDQKEDQSKKDQESESEEAKEADQQNTKSTKDKEGKSEKSKEGGGQGENEGGDGSGRQKGEAEGESGEEGKKGGSDSSGKDGREGEEKTEGSGSGSEKPKSGGDKESKDDQDSSGGEQDLNKAEQAVSEIKKELGQQGQSANAAGQPEQGKEAGESEEKGDSQTPKGEQGAKNNENDSGDKESGGKPTDGEKSDQNNEEAKNPKNDSGGKSASAKGDETKEQSEKSESRESTAKQNMQRPPDRRVIEEDMQGKPWQGLGENKDFKEVQVEPGKDSVDTRYVAEEGQIVKNEAEAKSKIGPKDLKLAKPESSSADERQEIPLEYREIIR